MNFLHEILSRFAAYRNLFKNHAFYVPEGIDEIGGIVLCALAVLGTLLPSCSRFAPNRAGPRLTARAGRDIRRMCFTMWGIPDIRLKPLLCGGSFCKGRSP